MKAVLVLNAGSSSLKFALYPFEPTLSEHPALSGQVEGIGATPRFSARDALGERFEADVPVQSASQREQHRDSLAFLPSEAYHGVRRLTEIFYRIRYGRHELSPGQRAKLDQTIRGIEVVLGPPNTA